MCLVVTNITVVPGWTRWAALARQAIRVNLLRPGKHLNLVKVLMVELVKQFGSYVWQCPSVCLAVNIFTKVFCLIKISAMKMGTNLKLSLKVLGNKFY